MHVVTPHAGSMEPGRMYLPVASTVSSALNVRPVPTALMLSPSTNTSATVDPVEVTTSPFFNSTLIVGPPFLLLDEDPLRSSREREVGYLHLPHQRRVAQRRV